MKRDHYDRQLSEKKVTLRPNLKEVEQQYPDLPRERQRLVARMLLRKQSEQYGEWTIRQEAWFPKQEENHEG
jgi:hypothetical protein